MRRCESRWRAVSLAWLFACVLWLLPRPVLAEPERGIDLVWVAPRGCPGAEHVTRRVLALTGPRAASSDPIRAQARITRKPDGTHRLKLQVQVDSFVGEREIEARSCADLAGSAAVALALLVRSGSEGVQTSAPEMARGDDLSGAPDRSDERAAQPVSSSSASATQRAADPSSPSSAARRSRRHRGLLRVPVGVLGVGPVQPTSIGFGLAAGLWIERWAVFTEGKLWLPERHILVRQAERYRADLTRYTVSVHGCRAWLAAPLELAPCASIAVEHMSARGSGPNIAGARESTTWLALGVGAQARVHAARWLRLVVGTDLYVQTARPVVLLDGVGRVTQLSPLALQVSLGAEWIL